MNVIDRIILSSIAFGIWAWVLITFLSGRILTISYPLNTPDYRKERTSIRRWSKKASASGVGSMCQEIRCSKDWTRKHERGRKDCGPSGIPCRRGSGGRGSNDIAGRTA